MSDTKPKPKLPSGREVVRIMRERTDTILVSFSGGKDSLCMWLRLRKAGFKIMPFYMYLCPDLQFVERGLAYYESVLETPITRFPHPSLFRLLRESVCASPATDVVLGEFRNGEGLWEFNYQDVYAAVKHLRGLPQDTFVALGVRLSDSLFALERVRNGVIRDDLHVFFPIWDLDKHRLIVEIKRAGVKLPVDYRLFGRSLDGIYRKFTEPIKKHYPDDYERLRQFFPMVEADIQRWKYARANRHLA